MKQYLFAALAMLTALLVSSCTNDDITIQDKNNVLTLSINTQSMYDDFDITERITNDFLREKTAVIGVTTFVYDSRGVLVDSILTPSSAMNSVSQTIVLEEGSYTLVTVEMLVNPDEDYKAEDWSFDDISSLSTLKITTQNSWTGPGSVIGVVTTSIDTKVNRHVDITPKAIGSLINYCPYDLEECKYEYFMFITDDISDYYLLDPKLSRTSRFHIDLTDSKHSYSRQFDNTEESTGYSWTFYLLEPAIDWCPAVNNPEDITNGFRFYLLGDFQHISNLEDGKTYYAGVYYISSSKGYRTYFGTRTGRDSWAEDCKKEKGNNPDPEPTPDPEPNPDPEPTGNLYTAPYTSWSVGTVSAVKSYMNSFYLYSDIAYDEDDKNYQLTYFDTSNNNVMYEYDFTSISSGLTDAWVFLSKNYFTLAQVQKEVQEQGYTYWQTSGDYYYYTNSTTTVCIYEGTNTLLVNYYNPNAYKSAPGRRMPKPESFFMELSRKVGNKKEVTLVKQSFLPNKTWLNNPKQRILKDNI